MAPPPTTASTGFPLALEVLKKIHKALFAIAQDVVSTKYPTYNDCPPELYYILDDFMESFTYDNSHPIYKFVGPQHILDLLYEWQHQDMNFRQDWEDSDYLRKVVAVDLAIRNKDLTCTLK
jgi:hypothetical protein